MFVSQYLASRFAKKQSKGFVGFVAKVSSVGVGLGCAALIILLSVMNGFERELRVSLLSLLPHAEFIHAENKGIQATAEFLSIAESDPRLRAVLPLNKAVGLVQKTSAIQSVQVIGASQRYHAFKYDNVFDWELLTDNRSVLLSKVIAEKLNITVGDKVQLLVPEVSENLGFKMPKSHWFSVAGVISYTAELNNAIAVVNSQALSEMMQLPGNRTSHIEFVMSNPFDAQEIVREYGYAFDQSVYLSSWYRTHGHLLYDIELVRTVIYIVLILLICIACFNVISSLVISVKEHSKSIAILKTMGATDQFIRRVFVLKGLKSTLLGAFWGCVSGTLIALYLSEIIAFIELLIGTKLLDSGIYFTDSIPSQLTWWNVLLAFFVAITVGWLATIYPANKAAKLPPADHLH